MGTAEWPTKLEFFMKSRHIKAIDLTRRSGYSRQHILRVCMGRMDPTQRCIRAITEACRYLANEKVSAMELFELG